MEWVPSGTPVAVWVPSREYTHTYKTARVGKHIRDTRIRGSGQSIEDWSREQGSNLLSPGYGPGVNPFHPPASTIIDPLTPGSQARPR
jgi:hypothetical protein